MKQLTGKALIRVLKKNGWRVLRVHGGHHVLGKKGSEVRLSIPVHGSKPLRMGLAKHLLKMAGLSEGDI